jgi:hypothetical protein
MTVRYPIYAAFLYSALNACSPTEADHPDIPGLTMSDDYGLHGPVFERAANDLLRTKRCSGLDFANGAAFYRSSEPNKYFVYCGAVRIDSAIYLRVNGPDFAFEP